MPLLELYSSKSIALFFFCRLAVTIIYSKYYEFSFILNAKCYMLAFLLDIKFEKSKKTGF